MKKVAIVVGTRPEAIKMAPVFLELRTNPQFDVSMIVTAQHRKMLDQVLEVFDIQPDVDLNVMKENQTLPGLTANVITQMADELTQIDPDAVLVHGDTTTCLASALAAFYQKIPVGHVEAGLRTYDLNAPWPEEMNRRLVDPISRWCFAPTDLAKQNLLAEKIPENRIFVTGNTVIDALNFVRSRLADYQSNIPELNDLDVTDKRVILVTGHRRESFGGPFEEFCLALKDVAITNDDVVIIYPVHLNPNVQEPAQAILGAAEGVHLIEPVDYLTMVRLMEMCHMVITDSGGIQEEAPSFGKPVLVTRVVTERPEAVNAGIARLVGMDRKEIVDAVNTLLMDPEQYTRMSATENPYGDGNASRRIADVLAADLLA